MIVDLPRFIATGRPHWDELEAVLDALGKDPLKRLSLPEALRFHYLYERVADTIEAEPIGRLRIRGISAEVMAYAVGGGKDPEASEARAVRSE